MDLGAIFVGLAMLAATLPFLIEPLQKGRGRNSALTVERTNPDAQRVATLSALRDLDFDFQTGKVSEEDYAGLRAQLLSQAAQFVRLEQENEDDEIEALIRAHKAAKMASFVCRSCGASLETGSRFCPQCGTAVRAACPSCGGDVRAGDLFCTSCGARLEIRAEAAS